MAAQYRPCCPCGAERAPLTTRLLAEIWAREHITHCSIATDVSDFTYRRID
jgi:hypothetical protein